MRNECIHSVSYGHNYVLIYHIIMVRMCIKSGSPEIYTRAGPVLVALNTFTKVIHRYRFILILISIYINIYVYIYEKINISINKYIKK